MNVIRPALSGRAAQRPSVTRGPNDLWLSASTAAETGSGPPAAAPDTEGGGK